MGVEFYKRNQFSFHQKYLCYLEYFQVANNLLGCHLVFFDWNNGLQMLYIKICFLVFETKAIGVNSSKNECIEFNI